MYIGKSSQRDHIELCVDRWQEVPQQEWVHQFSSTLDTVPNNWYVELELRWRIKRWIEMVEHFITTFSFEDDFPSIDEAL